MSHQAPRRVAAGSGRPCVTLVATVLLAGRSSPGDGGDSAPRVCGIFSRSLVDQLSSGVRTTSSGTITAPGKGPELQGCEIVSSGDQYLVATAKDLPTAARVRELRARVWGKRKAARSRCATYRAIEDPGSGYVCRTSDGKVYVNLVTDRRPVRLILPSRSEQPTVARGVEVAEVVAAEGAER